MKTCSVCKEEKTFDCFSPFKRSKDGYASACKPCASDRANKWQKDNPERRLEGQRKRNLAKHGLTIQAYNDRLIAQDYKCAVCLKPSDKTLHVDHDHTCCPGAFSCGKCIRGLLCSNCNTALGLVKDDPSIIYSMLRYLGH